MDTSKLLDELVRDECRNGKPELKIYFDSKGIPTIGIGRNLRKGLSKEEAYYLCNNDIEEVIGELDHALSWWRRLDETRQRVLANMCFNLGIAKLQGFEKFLGFAFAGDYSSAAHEMLNSDWAKQVGDRALRLADMMNKGDAHVAVNP